MPGRRWRAMEAIVVEQRIDLWRRDTIAAQLGRTADAVRRYCERNGIYATRTDWLRSGEAAVLYGLPAARLTALARARRIRARRVPGGRRWLFPPDGLERKT